MMISDNIQRAADGMLHFAGQSVPALAQRYGTPLYLMDEDRIRRNIRLYTGMFRECFGEKALPLYASKAASFRQIYRIVAEEGMGVDTVSAGEIHTALSAGFPAEKIFFHGDGKTDADIQYAVSHRIGYFIVDNPEELEQLSREATAQGIVQKILLRITPGIDPHTYKAVTTGTIDVKFGVPMETGQAFAFVQEALELPALKVCGLHCHIGSQVFDETVFEDSIDVMTDFMGQLYKDLGFTVEMLNIGGGFGVRYVDGEEDVRVSDFTEPMMDAIRAFCVEEQMPLPVVYIEPGRWIAANAGITLYTVGSIKEIPGIKTYVAVDGGMPDNPRQILYDAEYEAVVANKAGLPADKTVSVVGKCCESGDIVVEQTEITGKVESGDILYAGKVPQFGPLGVSLGIGIVFLVIGFLVFDKMKRRFSEVM